MGLIQACWGKYQAKVHKRGNIGELRASWVERS